MSIDADILLDRLQLKRKLSLWKTLTFIVIILLVISFFGFSVGSNISSSSGHIAKIKISGIIEDDDKIRTLLEQAENNKHTKAVIISLNTPGGTAVGGQELYLKIKELSDKKPVVILMRSLCTSAGYMAALGGSRIFAREGTITGSIGVIMQGAEFTDLAEKIGVKPIVIKSGVNKASPNPFEKLKYSQKIILQSVVDDFHSIFMDMVSSARKLDKATVTKLADGRIYSGKTALKLGLIDELGGEKEALKWLEKEHSIINLSVQEIKTKKTFSKMIEDLDSMAKNILSTRINRLDGLELIWQPWNIK